MQGEKNYPKYFLKYVHIYLLIILDSFKLPGYIWNRIQRNNLDPDGSGSKTLIMETYKYIK